MLNLSRSARDGGGSPQCEHPAALPGKPQANGPTVPPFATKRPQCRRFSPNFYQGAALPPLDRTPLDRIVRIQDMSGTRHEIDPAAR